MEKLTINPTFILDDEALDKFCIANRELRIERDTKGMLIIMAPTYTETGVFNFEIGLQLGVWNMASRMGTICDSSTGFKLPSGSVRSPNISFIARERWKTLSKEEKKSFANIVPDFVIELRSSNESLQEVQEQMLEWIENGVKLGWLIDVSTHKVYVYREQIGLFETKKFSDEISGEEILPNFTLNFNFLNDEE